MSRDDVVPIGLGLPGVEAGSAYGTPALRACGAFTCHAGEDDETRLVPSDPDERPLLVEAHDGVLFVTRHYQAWPLVLVSLPHAGERLARELVEDAWVDRAPNGVVAARRARREATP